MSSDSPAAIIFNTDGYEVSTTDGYAASSNRAALLIAGSDGSNYQFLHTDSSGNPIVVGAGTSGSPSGGVVSVQGVSGGQSLPISGSVTANIGTTNGLALDATLTGGTAKAIARGGAKGATAAADVTSENVDANTQALHVYIKGGGGSGGTSSNFNTSFPATGTAAGFNDGTNMQSAKVFDTDTGGGTDYVLGAVLRASASGGSVETGTSANPLRVDPTGTTAQPITDNGGSLTVDGTVTANIGTTNGLALDATLTGGTAKAIVRGGAKGATTAGDVTSENVDANTQALHVYIKGGGGSGGTASSFNAAFPATGTASGFSDGTNMQSARVYDGYTGAGTEYVLGTVLRASGATGTVETGTSDNPLRVDPTGTTFQPVRLFDANNTKIKATVSQELKIAQLFTFADLTSKYELDNRLWDVKTATGGTATHVASESGLRVSATGASGSTAEIITNTYYKYQSGYTQFISMSIINSNTGNANQVREWGYFDADDGVFFRLSDTTFYIVERTSTSGVVTETTYAQSTWNVDKLDGTGASGVTLDLSKGNIFELELQWFGVGTVRYSINGILVHEVAHANTLTAPYMRTGTLPIQIRITNTGASSSGYVTMICTRVAAQGQQQDPFEWVYAVDSATTKLVGLTEIPILSIRPKATFNGIVNRMIILPKVLSINTAGYRISYKLIYGPTLTGASWTSVNAKSGVEYDESATAYSGGELIYHGLIADDSGHDDIDISKFFNILGRVIRNAGYAGSGANVADILTIVAVNEAVGRTEVEADMTWAEIR